MFTRGRRPRYAFSRVAAFTFGRTCSAIRIIPKGEHLINRLQEHFVSVGLEIAERFGVRQQSAWAYAEIEPPVEQVVEHGDFGGDRGRMRVRMLIVPVPSLMRLVACASVAINSAQDVMFSALSVACSPTNPSTKPSSSARMKASRSSFRLCRQSFPKGWIGIGKKPELHGESGGWKFLSRSYRRQPSGRNHIFAWNQSLFIMKTHSSGLPEPRQTGRLLLQHFTKQLGRRRKRLAGRFDQDEVEG